MQHLVDSVTMSEEVMSAGAAVPGDGAEMSLAAQQAARNWTSNLTAIGQTQPELGQDVQAQPLPSDMEWVFGRDRTLTALVGGQWVAGTSLPGRVARSFLKDMNVRGTVACFLAPTHAAQLRAALEILGKAYAVVAVVPDVAVLRVMLSCEDLGGHIREHRLWFAWGEPWAKHLDALFAEHPGLPLPIHFLRLPKVNEELVNALIPAAQAVFAGQTKRQAALVESLREATRRAKAQPVSTAGERRVCVVAPSQFRLWDDAGAVLASALGGASSADGVSIERLDPDDPLSASPVALAMAGRGCSAVVTANAGRDDIPNVLPASVAWLTWITAPRVPRYDPAAGRDGLLLADPAWKDMTIKAGWPAERVAVAAWPVAQAETAEPGHSPALVIVADTETLEPPQDVKDLSSRRLLWEMITQELRQDPFILGEDVLGYLRDRMRRRNVSEEGLDQAFFIQKLVVPAYQQGLARVLVREGLPLRVVGRNWDRIEEFRGCCAEEGQSGLTREAFGQVIRNATALVHVWPALGAHPIDAVGRPVVRRRGVRRESFMREARQALEGKLVAGAQTASGPALSLHIVMKML